MGANGLRTWGRFIFAGWIGLACWLSIPVQAGTITVTSTADDGPGTLRAAITSAGNNDVLNFSLSYPATITLTTGELFITRNLTITGPGSANLSVSGNNGSRVFNIGTSNLVAISGLTIAGGSATAGGVGAGIYADHATLTLTQCVISGNNASGGSTAAGAGIYSNQSQVTVTSCTIDSNGATGNGGGIYNDIGSSLIINHSAINGNSALNGGGVYNASGTVTAINCLFYINAATHGGAIANVSVVGTAALSVSNCTLSSNSVSGTSATGSQIYNHRQVGTASAMIANSTIVSNNVSPAYSGGAIFNDNSAVVTIGNTIIKTSAQEGTINAASNVTSAGYNLSTDTGGGFLTGPADQINTDPLLDLGTGPRDNGGLTKTIALQTNSPAIDKGKRDTILGLAVTMDQRGEPRPFDDVTIPNAAAGDGSDIGAYEADLRMTDVARTGNNLQVHFTSIVGKNYQLQSRSSLISGTWVSFGTTVAGNGGIRELTASNAFAQSIQFYHVLQMP
jgi:hypothetical protein